MFFKKEKIVDETLLEEQFNSIRTELKSLDLEIKTGDNYEVHFSGEESKKPTVEMVDDTVIIKQPKKPEIRGIYVSVNLSAEKLVIIVPKDKTKTLDDIRLSSASGDIAISNIIGEDLKVNLASGDLKLKNVFLENGEINVASGGIDIDQLETMDLQASAASGNIKMKDSKFWGTADLSAVSGNLTVSGTSFRTYNLKTVSGESRLFNSSSKSIKKGTGQKPELKLSTVSGNNTVK